MNISKEQLRLIEKHIRQELTADEQNQFDQLLDSNNEFKDAVDQEIQLKEGLRRMSLRQEIAKARHQHTLKHWGLRIGLALIISGAALAGYFYFNREDVSSIFPTEEISIETPSTEIIPAKGDSWNLPTQVYSIDNSKDNVVESDYGIVLAIPKNAFVNQDGEPVSEDITIQIKEAFTASDIIKAGLTSTSDGDLLESGGMFDLTAMQGKDTLALADGKEIYSEIPTLSKKSGMQLYDGEETEDGLVNWVNPKKEATYLIPVNIHTLDFYPPGYIDALQELGYGNATKKTKDSLFYLFYCSPPSIEPESNRISIEKEIDNDKLFNSKSDYLNPKVVAKDLELKSKNTKTNSNPIYSKHGISESNTTSLYDEETIYASDGDSTAGYCRGIMPSDIQAIWNEKFQNTNIATIAFEKRLKHLYKSCDKTLLAHYINHLDQDFTTLDRWVADHSYGETKKTFNRFANENLSRVNTKKSQVITLSKFYDQKRKLYANAAKETLEKIWNQQQQLDGDARAKKLANAQENSTRKQANFTKEFDLNLTRVYKKLGLKRTTWVSGEEDRYQFIITNMGTKNIDRKVYAATTNRKTTTITANGKSTNVTYNMTSIKLESPRDYDILRAYFINPKLFSFERYKFSNNIFEAKLNGDLNYNTVVVGYKRNEAFVWTYNNQSETEELTASLKAISKQELDKLLAETLPKQTKRDITTDIRYAFFEIANNKRVKRNQDIQKVRNSLYSIVMPCEAWEEETANDEIQAVVDSISNTSETFKGIKW